MNVKYGALGLVLPVMEYVNLRHGVDMGGSRADRRTMLGTT